MIQYSASTKKLWTPFFLLNDKLPEEGNDYVKLPNGTLIQWGQAHFPSSGSGGNGYAVEDFTIPFVDTPSVTATSMYASSVITFDLSVQPRTYNVTIYARTNDGNPVTGASACWTAMGRWK